MRQLTERRMARVGGPLPCNLPALLECRLLSCNSADLTTSIYSPLAGTTGASEAMSLCAGESVSAIKRVQPAAEIVRELAAGTEDLLRRW